MTKSILVTGALGYVGTVLCRELLNRDYDVVGVDNCRFGNGDSLLSLVGHKNFQFHPMDVRWPDDTFESLAGSVDVVIPLAALVGAPLCDKYPKESTAVNVGGISSLMKLVGKHQRVIYPNTNSGYGETDGESFCTEADLLSPVSRYAKDKCFAESAVLSSFARSTVFRLATVFGVSPRMRLDLMVNDFTQKLTQIQIQNQCQFRMSSVGGRDEDCLTVFDPHFKRNFVHVMDVAKAFIFAIEHELDGVYNLGLPSANLTKLELAHSICDEIGLSREVVTIGDGSDPDKRNYIVSNNKILAAGFTFENDLQTGVREVHEVCKVLSMAAMNDMRNA